MKILVAPDSFKGTLTARDAAVAMSVGIISATAVTGDPVEIDRCPLADGGEGTGAILADLLSAIPQAVTISDPIGRPRAANWWVARGGKLGIVESAEACGLGLLTAEERDPRNATTYGVGQLVRAAIDAGVEELWVAVGGTATIDGGSGLLQALGCRFHDAQGRTLPVPLPAGALDRVARIDASELPAELPIVRVLCDVSNPLLGRQGAVNVYGPQKGVTPETVDAFERGMYLFAAALEYSFGVQISAEPGAGAGGGISTALATVLHGQLEAGFERVGELSNLAERLQSADHCLTGEGRIDAQTRHGKVISRLTQLASKAGVPVTAIGSVADDAPSDLAERVGVGDIVSLPPGLPETHVDAANRLEGAANAWLLRWYAALQQKD